MTNAQNEICQVNPSEKEIDDNIFKAKRKRCAFFKKNRSLFCFDKESYVRHILAIVIESKPFEYFILLNIIASTITLGLAPMLPGNDKNKIDITLGKVDYFYIVVFIIEAIMKIISMGFVLHRGAYLRNGWNVLDFSVILIGIISIILINLNQYYVDLKSLRTLRIIRVLRSLSSVPSLQIVLNSILIAIKPLGNIFLLIVFILMAYSITGMSLFLGQFHATCYNNVTGAIMNNPRPCRNDIPSAYHCTNLTNLPSGQSWTCQDFKYSVNQIRWDGPNYGITTFDNFFTSMITVFQVITLSGWANVLYVTNDAMGVEWPWIFYVSAVFLGAYFMLNLILGVLIGEFKKAKNRMIQRRIDRKTKLRDKETKDYQNYKLWIEQAELLNRTDIYYRHHAEDPERQKSNTNPSSSSKTSRMGSEELNHSTGNNEYKNESSVTSNMFNSVKRLISTVSTGNETQSVKTDKVPSFSEKFARINENIKANLKNTLKSRIFFIVMIILVFLNTVILSVEYTSKSMWWDQIQTDINMLLTAIFVVELILKIYSFGPKSYFAKIFNILDFLVIVVSLLEAMLTLIGVMSSIGLSSLRALRLIRLFKLTRYWDSLRNLTERIRASMNSIFSLLLLLFIALIIFSLIGMQIFGGTYNFDDVEKPRANYDTFVEAFMAVFQLITGESWDAQMYMGYLSFLGSNNGEISGMFSTIYFVVVVMTGSYILLNVFLGIAVENLGCAKEDINKFGDEDSDDENTSIDEGPNDDTETTRLAFLNGAVVLPPKPECDITGIYKVKSKSRCRSYEQRLRINIHELEKTDSEHEHDNIDANRLTYTELYAEDLENEDEDEQSIGPQAIPKTSDFKKSKANLNTMPSAVSLYMFSESNPFRRLCHRAVTHRSFTNIIMACIICSCLMLTMSDPTKDSLANQILDYFDYCFLIVFIMEIIFKIIALGFIMHKGSFLRNAFNWIDFIVVITGILEIILRYVFSNSNMPSMKFLRTFRVLRPLRTINRVRGLKIVIQCVTAALRSIGKLLLVMIVLEIIFAIIGINVFKGSFYTCTDITKVSANTCKGYFIAHNFDGSVVWTARRIWTNYVLNYDNMANALLTLFVVSTFSGWPKILYMSIDSVAENIGPRFNNRQIVFIYYLVFLVIIAFFMINLFVAFVIVTFQKEGEAICKNPELNKNQRSCIAYCLNIRPHLRHIPEDRNRYKVWRIITAGYVDHIIMACIIANTVLLSIKYDNDSNVYESVLDGLNMCFTSIFVVEASLKLYVYGFREYFDVSMNVFDFLVVTGGVVDIVFRFALIPVYFPSSSGTNLFKIFRVLRLIRLLRLHEPIRKLLWTFIKSLKAFPYVLLFVVLILFIFSVLGMQIFGKVGLYNKNSQITPYNNFQTFPNSLEVLFRCLTGDNWQDIMISLYTPAQALCVDGITACDTVVSLLFFPIFVLVSKFLIINLFVAVIMDNFDYLTNDSAHLGPHHLEHFAEIWSEYDIAASGRIFYMDLFNLLRKIDPPFGCGKLCPPNKLQDDVMKMHIPLETDGTVLFNATIFAIVRRNLNIMIPKKGEKLSECNEKLRNVIKTLWRNTNTLLLDQIIPPPDMENFTITKFYAVTMIHRYVKTRKGRHGKDLAKRQESLTFHEAESQKESNSHSQPASVANLRITPPSSPKFDTENDDVNNRKSAWDTLKDIYLFPDEKTFMH